MPKQCAAATLNALLIRFCSFAKAALRNTA